jgi:hypothetical protein
MNDKPAKPSLKVEPSTPPSARGAHQSVTSKHENKKPGPKDSEVFNINTDQDSDLPNPGRKTDDPASR